jgi:hypothetical protein
MRKARCLSCDHQWERRKKKWNTEKNVGIVADVGCDCFVQMKANSAGDLLTYLFNAIERVFSSHVTKVHKARHVVPRETEFEQKKRTITLSSLLCRCCWTAEEGKVR